MFNNNENIKNYFVYKYHHLDDLSAIQKISEVFRHFDDFGSKQNKDAIEKTIAEVKSLFLKNGWEGDGEIGVIWIPPFVDIGHFEDTWGSYLWHVKQSNNGTSFIASSFPINQKRLKDQNELPSPNSDRNMESINIVQDACEQFIKGMETKKNAFDIEYAKMNSETDKTSIGILEKIIGYTQCDLIAHLNDFIDGCYLTLLVEVLDNGNKGKIKLRKSSVKVDLSQHLPEEDEIESEGSSWMSIQMFISDIWRSYKFEPFLDKYDRLTKSVDFSPPELLRDFLFKHNIIRNCIQHHDWQLDASLLKMLGKKKIEIATDKEPIEIREWKLIELTKEEIHLLINNLTTFANEFNKHVNKRVTTRHYRPKDGDGSYIVIK